MKSANEALEWYGEQAEALSRYMVDANKNENGILAVLTSLKLDAGNRAINAIQSKPGHVITGGHFVTTDGYAATTDPRAANFFIAQLVRKYQKYIENLKWHINNNKPLTVDADAVNERIGYYKEMIQDLKSIPS